MSFRLFSEPSTVRTSRHSTSAHRVCRCSHGQSIVRIYIAGRGEGQGARGKGREGSRQGLDKVTPPPPNAFHVAWTNNHARRTLLTLPSSGGKDLSWLRPRLRCLSGVAERDPMPWVRFGIDGVFGTNREGGGEKGTKIRPHEDDHSGRRVSTISNTLLTDCSPGAWGYKEEFRVKGVRACAHLHAG